LYCYLEIPCLLKIKLLVVRFIESNDPGAAVLKLVKGVGVDFVDGDLELLGGEQ
jgi:hypothetical protein